MCRTKGGIRIPNRNIKLDEEGTLNLTTGERVISIMPSELEVRITSQESKFNLFIVLIEYVITFFVCL